MKIPTQVIRQAADILFEAHETGVACDPVKSLLEGASIETAYAVQKCNTDRWMMAGRRVVGKKIGLTAKTIQAQLKVDQPDYGVLYADMDVPDGEPIDISRVLQPRVEAEVAFVMAEDLDEERLTTADVISAIDYAVAAIEVVGSRVRDWKISILDTVADNASSGLYVIGQDPRPLGSFDMRLCGMVMERSGEPVSVGAGAACLGSPINATLWLARTMARIGNPLRKGDLVLSGALGPMIPARPGDVFEARINGLGSVRAAFAR